MAKNIVTKTAHRRRREQKTDFRKRLKLIKSKKHRLIIRKSLNNVVCQIVDYNPKGDRTILTVKSSQLKKLGWTGHTGNVPAAYLTGLLCGTRAKEKKITECILDLGLQISTKGSRLYATLKGVIDAGLNIPHSKEILPNDERIKGKIIDDYRKRSLSKNFDEIVIKIVKTPASRKKEKDAPI